VTPPAGALAGRAAAAPGPLGATATSTGALEVLLPPARYATAP